MDRPHALAALSALESALMPASVVLSFPGGVGSWTIQLDTSHVYKGSDLAAIASYCAGNGLVISATFSAFGIV